MLSCRLEPQHRGPGRPCDLHDARSGHALLPHPPERNDQAPQRPRPQPGAAPQPRCARESTFLPGVVATVSGVPMETVAAEREEELAADPSAGVAEETVVEDGVTMDADMEVGVGAEVELQEGADSVAPELSVGKELFSQSKWDLSSLSDDSSEEEGKGNEFLSQSKWDLSSLSADSSEDGCKTRGPRASGAGAGGGRVCRECGRSFPSWEELSLHFRDHQPEMTCNICRVVFRRVPSLRLHLSNAHRDASLRCHCGQAFPAVWDLNLHLASHCSHRELQCELCHMPCPSYAKLNQHRLMHAPRPPRYQPDRTATPPTAGASLAGSPQGGFPSRPVETPSLPPTTTQEEEWGDHAYVYKNRKRNNFAVVVRSVNSVTLRFPRDSVAEENRDKKIHVVVVRNVTGRKTEGIKQEEGGGDGDGRPAQVQGYRAIEHPAEEEEEEEEDVKPDVSSLVPPLPAALSSPALRSQDALKEEESSCPPALPDPALGDSETESIAESNPVLPESSSDSDSLPQGDSEFNPGEVSDASSEDSSFSSGNSSGSSYRPRKRRGSSGVGGGTGRNQPRSFQKPPRPIRPNPSSTTAPPAADTASHTASPSKCPHCGIAYSSPSLMLRHAQSCPERPVTVACELCSLTFPSQNSLIQHKAQGHHCVRMYACHLCREVFPDFVIFSRHDCPSLNSPSSSRQLPTSAAVQGSSPGAVTHDARGSPAVALISPPPPPPPLQSANTAPQLVLQPPAPDPNVATDVYPISGTLLSTNVASSSPSPNPNPSPDPHPAPNPEPLKILGLYVNLSKESTSEAGPLAPSTPPAPRRCLPRGVLFECRQCGASSPQPSLPVRHRYLHRGPRAHRCQCGKAFTRSLHLLRHQVCHAENSRYICGPCGATFTGASRLARHKKRKRRRRRNRKGTRRRACQDPFRCVCGLPFKKPAAYLWHKLKNSKSRAKKP
ncbi:uncharacterized protein LOC117434049 isoform X1 [Acipenser ruthenus]|uniref:uncharacterized protein LOC117434049 isoform X1 n=1 Tax=Acipenser ruthenus TaxID=7906 RepID=UPI002741D469|nr:uncharacterized protein LOC117434049 isoform X1 [Acipenser ruthenus]